MSAKNLASHVSTRKTPQSSPIPGKVQVANSAGGFVFQVDKWTRLDRFLVMGSEGGCFYAGERELTIQNVECLRQCADEDFARALKIVVDVSVEGRAPKNDYAILALAILAARPAPQSTQALAELSKVVRIGTHLFMFIEYVKQFRGRGRALKTALQRWYTEKTPLDVAFQATKYVQRNGFSHRDVLRLCKPSKRDEEMGGVMAYIVGKSWDQLPEGEARVYLQAVEAAKAATSAKQVVKLIEDHRLPREVIPTQFLSDPAVWMAMLPSMPLHALVRNLGKMSSIGLTKPLSSASKAVAAKLADAEYIRKSRLHPMAVLLALSVYRTGRGLKGSLTWQPDSKIVDALDGAFYAAFKNVEPTGKNHLIALDVSGSMRSSFVVGTHLSCHEAAAAMAMVTVNSEENTHVTAFASGGTFNRPSMHSRMGSQYNAGIIPFPLSPKTRLDDAVRQTAALPFGGTDCALPMLYATQEKLEVDVFVVITDSETWFGDTHPCQALNEYRQKMGRPAKLIVMAMVANPFSIADPADGGMLDCVGFSADVPQVIANFIRG